MDFFDYDSDFRKETQFDNEDQILENHRSETSENNNFHIKAKDFVGLNDDSSNGNHNLNTNDTSANSESSHSSYIENQPELPKFQVEEIKQDPNFSETHDQNDASSSE